MIRFIDLGCQTGLYDTPEQGGTREFAFFDTVVDRFVDLGGSQVWETWKDFADDHRLYMGNKAQPLERFKPLCRDWVFQNEVAHASE